MKTNIRARKNEEVLPSPLAAATTISSLREVRNGPDKKILVVDDEPSVVKTLIRRLAAEGYHCTGVGSAGEALKKLRRDSPALVLLDIRMSGIDGMELLPRASADYPDTAVVMVSAVEDLSVAVRAMRIGAYDYIVKPFNLDDVVVRVERALERRRLLLENRDHQRNLEGKVREQTEEIRSLYLGAIQSLITALEARDSYTYGHSEEVVELAVSIGSKLGLPREVIERIRLAALLHDVGKIGVRDSVLWKPGGLSDEEYTQVTAHPVMGEAILRPLVDDESVLKAIRHHHEHYDGSGYPDGLEGEEIPLIARILAVADAYQAMISKRSYQLPLSPTKALNELQLKAGSQFDPEIVGVLRSALKMVTLGVLVV